MAKSGYVWGIDVGQCALKALRCRRDDDDPQKILADAFDYIEYSKILSQPEADPVELVREAIQTFLKRNSIRNDKIAVSVSGQSGLARFIKLPPVESKKIPDIVKYEAKQQIPFPLEDVIWDYQQMAGGSIEEGFALETEVGLFAMKRDQVWRALKPFSDANIEVDVIQLTPLAIYNFTAFDQMPDLPPTEEYNPDEPPESVVVISLGTDTTDLVVTNGFRVWQRSLPLGGSHFTKALTKELRLTFASAEHLKRNATQAEDPKAVFQAMRPVFNDLLTEVQRSIAYFMQIDRTARIGRVVALGNAMKLPGLQKYLSQNLGYPVVEVESYAQLVGSTVTTAANFKDNLLSFPVCYGLAIQGLAKSKIFTNLIPQELITDRLIRDKKPWVVGTLSAVMLGCMVSFLSHFVMWKSADEADFKPALAQSQSVQSSAKKFIADFDAAKVKYEEVDKIGGNIVGNVDGRLLWLELITAINGALPRDNAAKPEPRAKAAGDKPKPDAANVADGKKDAKAEKGTSVEAQAAEISARKEMHIDELELERVADVGTWYTAVKKLIDEAKQNKFDSAEQNATAAAPANAVAAAPVDGAAPAVPAVAPAPAGVPAPPVPGAAPAAPPGVAPPAEGAPAAPGEEAPKGEGWIVQLRGHHFHNSLPGINNVMRTEEGVRFVRNTLIKKLEKGEVELPDENGKLKKVKMKDLGISYPVIVQARRIKDVALADPNAEDPSTQIVLPGQPVVDGQQSFVKLRQFDFVVQFLWQETPRSKRLEPEKKPAGEGAPAVASNNGG